MKKFFRLIGFLSLVFITLFSLNKFVFVEKTYYTAYNGFYKQKENSLDLVTIGNSTIRRGVNPCEIWENCNVTSYNICASPTHLEVILIAIEEIARTQTPTVMYIDINGLAFQKESERKSFVKNYISNMPNDLRKNELKARYKEFYLTDESEEKDNKIDLFSNHNEYRNPDFWYTNTKLQSYLNGYVPLTNCKKQKGLEADPTKTLPLSKDAETYLHKILELCNQYPQINFVFGKMPRVLTKDNIYETYTLRTAKPIIESYGYEYVDWNDYFDEIKLDRKKDFSDDCHLNNYGAKKFSNFYIEYLDAKYNISGKTHDEDVVINFDYSAKIYKEYFE